MYSILHILTIIQYNVGIYRYIVYIYIYIIYFCKYIYMYIHIHLYIILSYNKIYVKLNSIIYKIHCIYIYIMS